MQSEQRCSVCGATARIIKGSYSYKESGLDNVTLENIDLIHCDECRNEDPIIPALEVLHNAIANGLMSKPVRLDGKELRFVRKHLGMSGREFSRLLHIDHTTLSKWENGQQPAGPQSDLLVRALIKANKDGSLPALVEKLNCIDEDNIGTVDIVIDTETNELVYA